MCSQTQVGDKLQVPEGRGRKGSRRGQLEIHPSQSPLGTSFSPQQDQEAALSYMNVNFVKGAALPERAAERRGLREEERPSPVP